MTIRNNGQDYYKATEDAISFYKKEFYGGHGDLVKGSKLSARTVAKAMNEGGIVNSKSQKILRKALKEAGFKGDAFDIVE